MKHYHIYQQKGYPKRPKVAVSDPKFYDVPNTATLTVQDCSIHGLVFDFYCCGSFTKQKALRVFYALKQKALNKKHQAERLPWGGYFLEITEQINA